MFINLIYYIYLIHGVQRKFTLKNYIMHELEFFHE